MKKKKKSGTANGNLPKFIDRTQFGEIVAEIQNWLAEKKFQIVDQLSHIGKIHPECIEEKSQLTSNSLGTDCDVLLEDVIKIVAASDVGHKLTVKNIEWRLSELFSKEGMPTEQLQELESDIQTYAQALIERVNGLRKNWGEVSQAGHFARQPVPDR